MTYAYDEKSKLKKAPIPTTRQRKHPLPKRHHEDIATTKNNKPVDPFMAKKQAAHQEKRKKGQDELTKSRPDENKVVGICL